MSKLPTQLITAADGYGAAVIFASIFVYAVMLIAVKPALEDWAARRGKSEIQRSRLTMTSTLIPGLMASFVVDFEPIARAFSVDVRWAAIPAGAVFYALGGVIVHNIIKRIDPIGKIEEKIFGKTRREIDQDLEIKREAATNSKNRER